MNYETLASRVQGIIDARFPRKWRGVMQGSVNAAASAWGVPQVTLSRIVNGKNQNPIADHLLKIAEASGCSVDWLWRGKGEPPLALLWQEHCKWAAFSTVDA